MLRQRFGELVGARAQLIEQPSVLDGDDGLLGEIAEKLDLLFREQTWLPTCNIEGANRLIILHDRYGELRSVPGLDETNAVGLAVEIGLIVGDVRDLNNLLQCDAAA